MCACDGFAQRRPTRRRGVMSVAGAQPLDRPLDNRIRRIDQRITNAENDHILAARTRGDGLVMRDPSIRAVAADPVDQCGELHVSNSLSCGSLELAFAYYRAQQPERL